MSFEREIRGPSLRNQVRGAAERLWPAAAARNHLQSLFAARSANRSRGIHSGRTEIPSSPAASHQEDVYDL